MARIEREKQTVRKMVSLYCRHCLKQENVPDEYQRLADYACHRLDRCRYGERKTTCEDCPTHCYAPVERERIRQVMRWTGPLMIRYAPKEAVLHLWDKARRRPKRQRQ